MWQQEAILRTVFGLIESQRKHYFKPSDRKIALCTTFSWCLAFIISPAEYPIDIIQKSMLEWDRLGVTFIPCSYAGQNKLSIGVPYHNVFYNSENSFPTNFYCDKLSAPENPIFESKSMSLRCVWHYREIVLCSNFMCVARYCGGVQGGSREGLESKQWNTRLSLVWDIGGGGRSRERGTRNADELAAKG